jgi:PBP1b-binding outer membrane lipoprotein LpoB
MKILILMIVLVLTGCSDAPEETVKKQPGATKVTDKDHLLKGYNDNLQKAKDVEKKVLKKAEDTKKALEEASK